MIWASIFAAAKKIPYQVYILVGLIFAVWVFGNWRHSTGKAEVQARWDASVERGKVIVQELKDKQIVVNKIVDTKYIETVKEIYVKGDTIIKEIPVYIPEDTPDLPGGFRVLHDAAVSSSIPLPSESLGAAPVRVETATETIIDNYTTCLVIREEVVAWRQWYQEQALAWQTAVSK